MSDLIFVGGIHGVGKSALCQGISAQYNIRHYSAGELIFSRLNRTPMGKEVDDIALNQKILLEALETVRPRQGWILLDGHFCLITRGGKISRIPESTFVSLRPRGIIVVVDAPEHISRRLYERDAVTFDIEYIRAFQGCELRHARAMSGLLSIPMLVHNRDDGRSEVDELIQKLSRNSSSQ